MIAPVSLPRSAGGRSKSTTPPASCDHPLQLLAVVPAVAIDVHLAHQGEPRRLVRRPGRRVDDVADPDRIDRVVGLDDASVAARFADRRQLDAALRLLGRDAGRLRVEDRHLHLRPGTHPAIHADQHFAGLVIDVGDVAVRPVEDVLVVPFELVALARAAWSETSRSCGRNPRPGECFRS